MSKLECASNVKKELLYSYFQKTPIHKTKQEKKGIDMVNYL